MVQAAIRESVDAVVCNAPRSDESNASMSNVHDTTVGKESSASVSNESSVNVSDPKKAMLPANSE